MTLLISMIEGDIDQADEEDDDDEDGGECEILARQQFSKFGQSSKSTNFPDCLLGLVPQCSMHSWEK